MQSNLQSNLGTWLVIIGITLFTIGLLIKSGVFSWLGHLPGDIHIKRENFQFYFPIMTMIIVSIVLSAVIAIVRRFL